MMLQSFKKLRSKILLDSYLRGLDRRAFPRPLRRLVAGSELHKAWLAGWLGFIEINGYKYGPCDPYTIEKDLDRPARDRPVSWQKCCQ